MNRMDYKRISQYSKRAKDWKYAYHHAKSTQTIYEAYDKPSTAKVNAYYNCVSEMLGQGGWGKRIIGHNSMQFTFAYQCERDNVFLLRIITKSNAYEIIYNPF